MARSKNRRKKSELNNNWSTCHRELRPGDEHGGYLVKAAMFYRNINKVNMLLILGLDRETKRYHITIHFDPWIKSEGRTFYHYRKEKLLKTKKQKEAFFKMMVLANKINKDTKPKKFKNRG